MTFMDAHRPRRPTHLSEHSRVCLQALAERGLGSNLARIAQHRRLEQIVDLQRRSEAEQVRAWFMQEFLNALPSGLD